MRAAERDAKRAEAIRDRPKGSTFAHAANGRRETTPPKCGTCGAEMAGPSRNGIGVGGVCNRCIADTRRTRATVVASRLAAARGEQTTR